jgi:hypothetical protein
MLKRAVGAGAADGVTGKQQYSVDSLPLKANTSVIKMLEGLIHK